MTEGFRPGSAEELRRFEELQARLPGLFHGVFADPLAPRTVVVVPGLSLDPDQLSRIPGMLHYEERHLSMLLLLRMPNTRLVFVTSQPLHPLIVDYYLDMLHGVPPADARRRLCLLSAFDGSPPSLTRKLLDRPRLLARLRDAIGDPDIAHLSVFVSSPLERSLAVRLGIPLYACNPDLTVLGGKSGARRLFREAGVPLPDGSEGLRDASEVVEALVALKGRQPGLRRAVIKLDEGFSGEGNALFEFHGAPVGASLHGWVRSRIPRRLRFEATGESWDHYCELLSREGGIVEAWIEAEEKHSPSVQFRINPFGDLECISTHDQVLGGPTGQLFLGSTFPARDEYRQIITGHARQVAERLRDRGVIGRFAVDFVVARDGPGWRAETIEINLRKGGTTFPLQLLQLLTDGACDPGDGQFRLADGATRCYYATDNLANDSYRRLTPVDVVEVTSEQDLHFDPDTREGVVFSMLGGVAEHGKLGITSIAATHRDSMRLYDGAVRALDEASA